MKKRVPRTQFVKRASSFQAFLSFLLICIFCALTFTGCITSEKGYYEKRIEDIRLYSAEKGYYTLNYHKFEAVTEDEYIDVYHFDKRISEKVHNKAVASIESILDGHQRIDMEWKFTDNHIYYQVTCTRDIKELDDIDDMTMDRAIFISSIIQLSSDQFDSGKVINSYKKGAVDLENSDCVKDNELSKDFSTHFCYKCMMDEFPTEFHINRRIEMDYKIEKSNVDGYKYKETMIFTDDETNIF